MAKIRFNDYLKKKDKQEEILFESDEDILRRVRDRMEADSCIVSPDYRIENYRQSERLVAQIDGYPGTEGLQEEFRRGKKDAEQEKRDRGLILAKQHLQEACTEDEYRKAQKEFAALDGYLDSGTFEREAAAKADICRKKTTRARWIRLVLLLILIAAAAAAVASGLFGYLIAKAEGMAGIYVSARNRFEKMEGFLDSEEQAEYYNRKYLEQRELQEKSTLSDAGIGDTVDFGGFTWIVADCVDTQLTLVLKSIDPDDVFGPAAYNDSAQEVTWADSSLREYLNNDALQSFAPAEQKAMVKQSRIPASNPVYGTDGGKETEDLIRIPDTAQIRQYLEGGLFTDAGADIWLCTPGHDLGSASFLTKEGRIVDYGDDVTDTLNILAVIVVDHTALGQ